MNPSIEAASSSFKVGEWRRGGGTPLAAAIGYKAGPVLFLTTASHFIKPVGEATGWPTHQVLISPWISGIFSLSGPLVSRKLNRRGVRLTAVFGLVTFVLRLVAFAIMPLNHSTFYFFAAQLGLAVRSRTQ